MAADIYQKGGFIFEKTRVVGIKEEKEGCLLNTDTGHQIAAKNVVIATHTPTGIHAVQLFTAPYRSYVVATHLKDNKYPEGHFWDLDHPHHATCTHGVSSSKPDLLLVAGSHHKTGQDPNMLSHYKDLENFLYQNFSIEKVAYQWSAQHYHSADDVPYIGLASRFAKHTYMATGYFADGLVYGTVAGIIMSDLIIRKDNTWSKVYNSTRFTPLASTPFLIKEDGNVFLQYYKDFPKSQTHDFADLKAGQGKVMEIDREKWGVYRDDYQKLHIVSAVCTHMKCIVNWNNAEKTWDCPCHGSRFTTEGNVIEGPARIDLKKKE